MCSTVCHPIPHTPPAEQGGCSCAFRFTMEAINSDRLEGLLPIAVASVAVFLPEFQEAAPSENLSGVGCLAIMAVFGEMDEGSDDGPRMKRSRTCYPRPDYSSSTWAVLLKEQALNNPPSRAATLFRRRFRAPHPFSHELVKLVKQQGWFATAAVDVTGRQCILVELRVRSLLEWARGCCWRRRTGLNSNRQQYMDGVHVALHVLLLLIEELYYCVNNRTKKTGSQS